MQPVIQLADGRICSGGGDRSIKVWNPSSGEASVKTFTGHTDDIYCLPSLSDKTVCSGSFDKSIKIWNIDTGECTKTLSVHTSFVRALLQIGQSIISGSNDNTV